MAVETVVTILGGSGIAVAAAAWLTKALTSHFLSKDVETYKARLRAELDKDLEVHKARLKAESDKDTEQFKATLTVLAREHDVRFTRLHEKRAQVIADLYTALVLALGDVGSLKRRIEEGKPTSGDDVDSVVRLRVMFDRNRIYFSEAVCEKMDDIIEKLKRGLGVVVLVKPSDLSFSAEQKQNLDLRLLGELEREVPGLRDLMEREFRQLLGVE